MQGYGALLAQLRGYRTAGCRLQEYGMQELGCKDGVLWDTELGDTGLWAARLKSCGTQALGMWDEGLPVAGCKDTRLQGYGL